MSRIVDYTEGTHGPGDVIVKNYDERLLCSLSSAGSPVKQHSSRTVDTVHILSPRNKVTHCD